MSVAAGGESGNGWKELEGFEGFGLNFRQLGLKWAILRLVETVAVDLWLVRNSPLVHGLQWCGFQLLDYIWISSKVTPGSIGSDQS